MAEHMRPFILGSVFLLASLVAYSMTSYSAAKSVTVDCVSGADATLPAGFASDFCATLSDEINRNYSASKGAARIEVALTRAGQFGLKALVTVKRHARADGSQDFNLSVRDSTLRPSIAKTLLLPVLKLLD